MPGGEEFSFHFDPALTALNQGINLPDAPITVAHRSDSSGINYIFTNYLSGVDSAWAAKVGTSKTPAGRSGKAPKAT